jgi:hypothetical protein
VHSEYVVDSRSRVRVRVGSPPHRPLGRIRFFVVSSISARRARSRLRRTSEPPSTPSTPSLKKRSTIEAFDAAQNARPRLPPLTSLPPDAFVASFRTHPQCL